MSRLWSSILDKPTELICSHCDSHDVRQIEKWAEEVSFNHCEEFAKYKCINCGHEWVKVITKS